MFDTAGQERFKNLTTGYYRQANAVILVYDVSDRVTFDSTQNWVYSIDKHAQPNVMKVLVANKVDLKREVTSQEGIDMAKQYGMKYVEASAFSGQGTKEIFEDICEELVTKLIADQNN